jgi:hypothetical protein
MPGCAAHLRRGSAVDVPANTPEYVGADLVATEACDVETELGGMAVQIAVCERVLAIEQEFVHVPEPVLECGCLRCGRRCEGVRVDVREREMAEGEADAAAQRVLDTLDFSKRPPRVGALVIAVLNDEVAR